MSRQKSGWQGSVKRDQNRGVIGPKSGSPGRSLKRGGHGGQSGAKWK
ncbi:hypothetical protein IG631_01132 [Alternaria alternata]|nr:hypothetical protein IG631_01132 [Alternaria alternata]